MQKIIKSLENDWPYFAGLASILMLGAAHAFEEFGKLYPCILCLHQREVYWIAFGVCVLAVLIRHFNNSPHFIRAFDAILGVIFLASAFVAGFHMGVEQHWWKGIAGCSGGGPVNLDADILGALSRPQKAPGCDTISWTFLGLSMAVWNMIISAFLAAFSINCAIKLNSSMLNFNGESQES